MSNVQRRIIAIVGLGLGNLMAFNSFLCLFVFRDGFRQLTAAEWSFNFAFTAVLGLIIIYWTHLILKKRSDEGL